MDSLAGLADGVGFGLLDPALAKDVTASLQLGVSSGAQFDSAPDPLAIFRQSLCASIYKIEADPR